MNPAQFYSYSSAPTSCQHLFILLVEDDKAVVSVSNHKSVIRINLYLHDWGSFELTKFEVVECCVLVGDFFDE